MWQPLWHHQLCKRCLHKLVASAALWCSPLRTTTQGCCSQPDAITNLVVVAKRRAGGAPLRVEGAPGYGNHFTFDRLFLRALLVELGGAGTRLLRAATHLYLWAVNNTPGVVSLADPRALYYPRGNGHKPHLHNAWGEAGLMVLDGKRVALQRLVINPRLSVAEGSITWRLEGKQVCVWVGGGGGLRCVVGWWIDCECSFFIDVHHVHTSQSQSQPF